MSEIPAHISDKALRHLLREVDFADRIQRMDNRELLWRCMQTPFWRSLCDLPADDTTVALVAALECRLYPEYDGDTVECMDWGWKTPEGEIRYVR